MKKRLFCLSMLVAMLCTIPFSCGKKDDEEKTEDDNRVSISEYPPYTVISIGKVTFNMLKVQGGTFTMGSSYERDSQAFPDEINEHSVTLSSYCIGETEVTQALWEKVMGDNPSNFKGTTLPVESASYNVVTQSFIPKLNSLTGLHFRLPTEAEWEFAARGGGDTVDYRYSGSNTASEVAWYSSNSDNTTHPVKGKKQNELRLYDMSGNVWEWCSDWHDSYGTTPQTNPRGPSTGVHRVVRGGSWTDGERYSRNTCRLRFLPENQYIFVGFRLAMDVE